MQKKVQIAPSILAANFACLGEEVEAITEAGADLIHVDVMDGHFVPNITMGPDFVQALRPYSGRPFDVHLMVAPVDPFIKPFADSGADIITVHVEAGPHLHRTIQLIKESGKKVGVSLNPSTPESSIANVIDFVDLILVMSVSPGFGGQKFIEGQLDKINRLRNMIDNCGRAIDLEVDGGINFENAPKIIEAGADLLVVGTAAFSGGKESYADNIRRLRGDADCL